jgi:hypothetical protein
MHVRNRPKAEKGKDFRIRKSERTQQTQSPKNKAKIMKGGVLTSTTASLSSVWPLGHWEQVSNQPLGCSCISNLVTGNSTHPAHAVVNRHRHLQPMLRLHCPVVSICKSSAPQHLLHHSLTLNTLCIWLLLGYPVKSAGF